MDSSIRLKTGSIQYLIDSSKNVGLLLHYEKFKLTCYTDRKMFEWFNENPHDHETENTGQAGFILIQKTFLSSLILKSWVTCALDRDCIAPLGSQLGSFEICKQCVCHRYDQDALSISIGFFIGQPKEFLPITGIHENWKYYKLERRKGIKYFV